MVRSSSETAEMACEMDRSMWGLWDLWWCWSLCLTTSTWIPLGDFLSRPETDFFLMWEYFAGMALAEEQQ